MYTLKYLQRFNFTEEYESMKDYDLQLRYSFR